MWYSIFGFTIKAHKWTTIKVFYLLFVFAETVWWTGGGRIDGRVERIESLDCPAAALIWSSGRLPWGAFPGLNGQARIYTGGHSRIYRGSPLIYLKTFHNMFLGGCGIWDIHKMKVPKKVDWKSERMKRSRLTWFNSERVLQSRNLLEPGLQAPNADFLVDPQKGRHPIQPTPYLVQPHKTIKPPKRLIWETRKALADAIARFEAGQKIGFSNHFSMFVQNVRLKTLPWLFWIKNVGSNFHLERF